MNRILVTFAVLFFALGAAPALADKDHAKHHAGAVEMLDGDVRKVDKDAKKITIKHGPIPSLDMPAMTMVFQVKEPVLLDKVKAGDKVRFKAEQTGTAYVVTVIEPVR